MDPLIRNGGWGTDTKLEQDPYGCRMSVDWDKGLPILLYAGNFPRVKGVGV